MTVPPEAIILDTDVVALLMRTSVDETAEQWLDQQDTGSIHLTTITRAEIRCGIARLPIGTRRDTYQRAADRLFNSQRRRTWTFDADAADAYGEPVADRGRQGRPISIADGQIAAIARCHNAVVATLDVQGFVGTGVEVVDPFAGA